MILEGLMEVSFHGKKAETAIYGTQKGSIHDTIVEKEETTHRRHLNHPLEESHTRLR